MNNIFKSIVVVNIKTKNIERLLNSIYHLNITILNTEVISNNEINITIYEEYLDKIKKISILNDINVVEYKGINKIKKVLNYNRVFILSIFIGIAVLVLLCNIVFDIEIIHSNNELSSMISKELYNYGVKKYTLKKSFDKLSNIKSKILENNKDKIEWMEIESVGTKYIIRFEERVINNTNTNNTFQNIVAKRDAVIKRVVANKGVIVKNINEYVKKGEVIISGNIMLNDEVKNVIHADGDVYGEVWYKVNVEYPIVDVFTSETGNSFNTYSFNIFNKKFLLSKRYKNYNIVSSSIFKNNILPISISRTTLYETVTNDGIYSESEAIINTRAYAKEKIKEILKEDEYIISDKVLNYRVNSNTIYMEVFYKVYCNITDVEMIDVTN